MKRVDRLGCRAIAKRILPISIIIFAYSAAVHSQSDAAQTAVDQYTVELFDTYCQACHTVTGAGAPLAFDAGEWARRLQNGLDPVVNAAITGVGNMPAQGSCMECSYEDFEALIRYMAKPATKK